MERIQTRYFSWYLTKYVSKDVVFGFFVGTSLFLLIMLMFQAIRLSEFIIVHQVGFRDVAKLSISLMLSFLPIAVPIAFLFAVLMGISRANSEGEILALQANGISLGQVFLPVGVFSVLVSFACTLAALFLVPRGNRTFELLVTRLGNERALAVLKPGVFTGFHGLVLLTEQIVPLKNELKRVFIYDDREEKHPLIITAQAGLIKNQPEEGRLTLRLSHGSIHLDAKAEKKVLRVIDFDVYDINLDLQAVGSSWRDYSPPSFDYFQLQKRIVETAHDEPQKRRLQVELHRRFALSFACVVFAALGFFIGILAHKGVRSTAVIVCLVVGLLYWLSYIGANAMAVTGWVWPALGVWAPNVLFAAVAYGCYRRVRIGR